MIKFSGIIVVVTIIMFVVVEAPNIYAQDWKTYREPSQFSIDYPVFEIPENITKEHDQDLEYDMITIDSNETAIMIIKSHNPLTDPQEYTVMSKENTLKINPNLVIIKDIFTSIYDGNIGYTYVTQNLDDGSVIAHTYIQRGYDLYDFDLIGFWDTPELFETFDKILESIKFFD